MNYKASLWHLLRHPGWHSFSQCGEDMIVWHLLRSVLRVPHMRYLDIGANHPVSLSNTYFLYRQGGQGVCIDPVPGLERKWHILRPKDIFLSVGIQIADKREAKLFLMNPDTFSTFSESSAKQAAEGGQARLVDIRSVPLVRMSELLTTYFPDGIEFLNIDVEGLDLEILREIDFREHRPRLVCIEISHEKHADNNLDSSDSFLVQHGYQRVAYTCYNAIFIDKERPV